MYVDAPPFSDRERKLRVRRYKPTRIFTRMEIEAAYLKSQQMKIEAYKQAQQALKKPFSV